MRKRGSRGPTRKNKFPAELFSQQKASGVADPTGKIWKRDAVEGEGNPPGGGNVYSLKKMKGGGDRKKLLGAESAHKRGNTP